MSHSHQFEKCLAQSLIQRTHSDPTQCGHNQYAHRHKQHTHSTPAKHRHKQYTHSIPTKHRHKQYTHSIPTKHRHKQNTHRTPTKYRHNQCQSYTHSVPSSTNLALMLSKIAPCVCPPVSVTVILSSLISAAASWGDSGSASVHNMDSSEYIIIQDLH